MATPSMTPVSVSHTITPGSAGSIRLNTLDGSGAALDVSAGFAIGFMKASPAADNNVAKSPVDVSGVFTPAFDATGVTLDYTAAQASAIAALLATLRSTVGVGLTNDAGTTKTLAAIIAIQVRPDAFLS